MENFKQSSSEEDVKLELVEEKSENKSRANKILFALVILAIAVSVGVTFWRIMIKKDYIISSQVDCDPTVEKCFVWECDETLAEGEDGACTGNEEEDSWYYKNVQRKAFNIPLCNPEEDETCFPFQCNEGEEDCNETLCDEINVPEGEFCNDPEEYLKNNPIEEEEEGGEEEEIVEDEENGEEVDVEEMSEEAEE